MPKKFTSAEFIANAQRIHGNTYDYSRAVYNNQTTPVEIVCRLHGAFHQKPVYHTLNAAGCPACSGNTKLNEDRFIRDSTAIHGETYDYSLVRVINNTAPVKILCRIHGVFEQSPKVHRRGAGCPVCGGTAALSRDEVVARFTRAHGTKYDYSRVEYTNAQGEVDIICPTHGVFKQRAQLHWDGRRCPKCVKASMGEQFRLPRYVVLDRLQALNNGYAYDLSEYKNKESAVSVTCNKGHVFQQRVADAYRHGCPVCARRNSTGEQELLAFIQDLRPDAHRTRKLIPPKELDVWVPSAQLGFEFNGLYYHSSATGKSTDYHLDKSTAVASVGGRLIHIWADDWEYRRSACEGMIKAQLGCLPVIGARSCAAVQVDAAAAKSFLEANHLQGHTAADYVGLEHDGALVCIMGFSTAKSVRGNTDKGLVELVRFAASCRVRGGASKLLKYWQRSAAATTASWHTIITYCDLAQFGGGLYEAMGFTKVSVSKPDYRVILAGGDKRLHKSTVKKDNLKRILGPKFDAGKTEAQMCAENHIFRVWDCGKTKYAMTRINSTQLCVG